MRRSLPRTEGLGQHTRGGTRQDVAGVRALDVSTIFFSLLPRLMTVYVEENEEYLARGMSPLT